MVAINSPIKKLSRKYLLLYSSLSDIMLFLVEERERQEAAINDLFGESDNEIVISEEQENWITSEEPEEKAVERCLSLNLNFK